MEDNNESIVRNGLNPGRTAENEDRNWYPCVCSITDRVEFSVEDGPTPIPDLAEVELPERKLPATRNFMMGFAYQPYDWS